MHAILEKNLKTWEDSLSYLEFAYNIVMHSSISYSPFEVVCGFNPLPPLDLLPLPIEECASLDGKRKTKLVWKIYEKVRILRSELSSMPTKLILDGKMGCSN